MKYKSKRRGRIVINLLIILHIYGIIDLLQLAMNNNDIFTSIIRVKGNTKYKVIPVKSSKPIDKALWLDVSKVLSRLYVSIPVQVGNVICKNILNTGVDIICTRTIYDEC